MGSQNWKTSEKKAAEAYIKFGIPAARETRADDYSKKDYEVKIYNGGNPIEVVTDSKYSQARPFRHHGELRGIKAKYCPEKYQIPALYSRNYKEHGGFFTVEEDIWAGVLSVFLGYKTKEEVLQLWGVYGRN